MWRLWMLPAAALAGCLQVDTHIALHPDGSATVTERLQFSRELLDLDSPAGGALAGLLSKEAASERMKRMGTGVSLVSHAIRDAERASRESVAVFRIEDMGQFTYVSPFLPREGARGAVALKADWHAPMRDGSSWEHIAGWLGVQFQPVYDLRALRREASTQPEPAPTPLELQMARELRPLFGDLMKELRIRVVFESYAPVLRASFGWRDARSATRKVDLIDFAPYQNNDMYGFPFLDNEEIMLDLLRWNLQSPTLAEHLKGWTNNQTLPALHREGTIYFKPSLPLFKRFFEGKTLTHHRTGEVPARFEDIGYKGGSDNDKPAMPAVRPPPTTGPDSGPASGRGPAQQPGRAPRTPGRRPAGAGRTTTAPEATGP